MTGTVVDSAGQSGETMGAKSGLSTISTVDQGILSSIVDKASASSAASEKTVNAAILFATATICLCVAGIVAAFISIIIKDGNTIEVTTALQSLTIIGSTGFGTLVVMLIGKSAISNLFTKLLS